MHTLHSFSKSNTVCLDVMYMLSRAYVCTVCVRVRVCVHACSKCVCMLHVIVIPWLRGILLIYTPSPDGEVGLQLPLLCL